MDLDRWQRVRVTVFACVMVFLSGCVSGGRTELIKFDAQKTRLVLITADKANAELTAGRPALLRDDSNKANENKLITDCGGKALTTESGVVGAVLGLLLGSAINAAFESIDEALQNQIKEYSQAYSAERGVSFYKVADISTPQLVATEFTCLRFVRGAKTGDAEKEAFVDFVAAIRVVDSSWIELRPLRLYFSQPVALSFNRRYGVAVKLKATTVHRAEATGSRAVAFDDVVLSEKVDLSSQPQFVKYYSGNDAPVVRLPLVPSSVPIGTGAREFTTFEVVMAETGTPSRDLVRFAKIFSGSREEIAKVLAAAANESLGWETE